MSDVLDYAKAGFVIVAVLGALSSATSIMNGNFKQGFTPGWVDFATAHPTLFALILVGGAVLFGGPFLLAVENT